MNTFVEEYEKKVDINEENEDVDVDKDNENVNLILEKVYTLK